MKPWIRSLILVTAVPLVVLTVAVVTVLSWRADLPDPLAVHWSTHGEVDDTGSLSTVVLAAVAAVVVCTGIMGAVVVHVHDADRLVRGMLAATSSWFAVFVSALLVGLTSTQRGVGSATDVGSPAMAFGVAIGFATAAAVGAWAVTPKDRPVIVTTPVPAHADRLPISPGEHVVWTRSAASRPGLAAGAGIVALGALLTVVTWSWVPLLVTALAGAFVLSAMSWRVTVDRRGLTARPLLRVPSVRVPLDEVEAAESTNLRVLREFGGFGIRLGRRGRTGIVLRAGEALEVRRAAARTLVITVDDAKTGAALLNTLAARTRT